MLNKQNLHVHSTFCDGKDAPAEVVEEAIARGMDSIGFSIHSRVPYSPMLITDENIENYKREIRRLKSEYKDKIKIFLGVEHDFYSSSSPLGFEYSLIAIHYLKTKNGIRGFDRSLEATVKYVNENFDGDGMAFAKCYYETLAASADGIKFDIIAHIDLVAKNNEMGRFFDEDSKEYLGYAYDAIAALKGKVPFFEVNTGAISRGYRSSPYPQKELLQELLRCGFGVIITSDCHDKGFLDCHFEEARNMLIENGFKSRYILTDGGFCEVEI
jgi:histidinol-phosphatase (PHP family)